MSLLIGAFTVGLILALLALGVYLSFRIFNFADITTEGSITMGAAISASVIVAGHHPLLGILLAMIGGFLAGAATGFIHTKFEINGLLAGILVMTALYSINLHIMGRSNIPLMGEQTLITSFESAGGLLAAGRDHVRVLGYMVSSKDLSVLISMLLIVIFSGVLLFLFLRSNLGAAMRATGNNQQMIRALGVNTKSMIILGLAISNALIALSGALLAQYQGFADVQMGIGMLVWGLASVIIGETLVSEKSPAYMIAGAVIGSVIFRLLVAVALRMGMNPNDLKLITALFVLSALILPVIIKKTKAKGLLKS